MHDERIVRRPFLGGEHALNRRAIEGVRAQAVDGLGRERDEPAVSQALGRARNHRAVGMIGIHP